MQNTKNRTGMYNDYVVPDFNVNLKPSITLYRTLP